MYPDYSLDWLIQMRREYEATTGRPPAAPSDWNTPIDHLGYPTRLISDSIRRATKLSHEYSLMYEMTEYKRALAEYLSRAHDFNAEESSLAISGNGTAALFLAINALRRHGVDRTLVVTPVYFAVLEAIGHCGMQLIYYHLSDKEGFTLDPHELQRVIRRQAIQCIVLTDPVYSVGLEVEPSQVYQVVEVARETDTWILYDYIQGGFLWNLHRLDVLNIEKIRILRSWEKSVVLDSVSKRLFTNGLKIAVTFGAPRIVGIMESMSNFIDGGFCCSQLQLFLEVFSVENRPVIRDILSSNVERFESNYRLLTSALLSSDYALHPINSGYYAMIHHRELTFNQVDVRKTIKNYLFNHGVFLLPANKFALFPENQFAFRVNLSKNTELLLPSVLACIREEPNLTECG